jgi:hypothetical protein
MHKNYDSYDGLDQIGEKSLLKSGDVSFFAKSY